MVRKRGELGRILPVKASASLPGLSGSARVARVARVMWGGW